MKRKTLSILLAVTVMLGGVACQGSGAGDTEANKTADTAADDTAAVSDAGEQADTAAESAGDTAGDSQEASEDGEEIFGSVVPQDIAADLTVFTNRTDLIDTVYAGYIEEFRQLYPNVNITYEAMTDYEGDMTIRLTTDDWGDICMIPKTVAITDLDQYFAPLGALEDLDPEYNIAFEKSSEGQVYGLPWICTAQGMLYNKKVFEEAGVTELPKTPDEFIAAMKLVSEKTEAIPLYTNYAAGWPLAAWEDYCVGNATGNENYKFNELVHADNPFAEGTPHYSVYKLMYDLSEQGLIEEDPTTTDWEACKGMMGRGEIATMALGSWAIVQVQEQADNPEDIGYMPFPITVDDQQYATLSPDYCFGINAKAPEENILASKAYVHWLLHESGFSESQGAVSAVKADPMPVTLDGFEADLVACAPATVENEGLFDKINDDSEVGLTSNEQKARIIEAGTGLVQESFDDIMNDWNQKWTAAQQSAGVK